MAAAGGFTTFEAMGAGTGAMQGTAAFGVNAAGETVGAYIDSAGELHGFLRSASGLFTTIDASSADTGAGHGTIAIAINAAGAITGTYIDNNTVTHGFVRSAAGVVTLFDAPNAGSISNRGTVPLSINAAGEITGFFSTGSATVVSIYHGFLRSATGTVTVLSDPDAGTQQDPDTGRKQGTQAFAINNAGEITGSFIDSGMNRHGFVRSATGVFTNFDPPNTATSVSGPKGGNDGTLPLGIDSAGDVAGTFYDTSGKRHGFLRAADGAITVFDPMGATTASGTFSGTVALGFDPAGISITGVYSDAGGVYHGFVRNESGAIDTLNAPGAGTAGSSLIFGTLAAGVNDSGEIAGTYIDSKETFHGFLFTPTAKPTAALPKFSPAGGAYASSRSVTISDATAGATIHYTLDKSTPTSSSTRYTAPIEVKSNSTIKAIAVASGYANSAVATAAYTIAAAIPVLKPIAGNYRAAQTVTITDGTAGAKVYYTLTGATPTIANWTQYTAPIHVAKDETVKVIAVATGHANSAVATAVYKIGLPAAAAPKLSPGTGTYVSGQKVTLTESTAGTLIYYTTDGTSPTTQSTRYTAALKITKTTTVKAMAAGSAYSNSPVATATYTVP